MPQIIVIADEADEAAAPIMFRERVTVSDFESEHFTAQLVERLSWAVGDADDRERTTPRPGRRRFERSVSAGAPARNSAGDAQAPVTGQGTPRSASVVTTAS